LFALCLLLHLIVVNCIATTNRTEVFRQVGKLASLSSGILINCQNRIIQSRILQLIQQKAAGIDIQPFEEHAYEFGGCEYLLVAGRGGGLRLLLGLPQLEGSFQQQVLGPDVMEAVAAAFRGVATVSQPSTAPAAAAAAEGDQQQQAQQQQGRYQVALDVDLALLCRLSGGQREGWSRSLASLRLLLAGHPLRQVFRALEAGSLSAGPPVVCCNTPGQVYIIRPVSPDCVALVFPLRFTSRQDCAIGVACMQEFVEARRGASLGRAPSCNYLVREVPRELAGVDLSSLLGSAGGGSGGGHSGGYLVFSLTRRHVAGPQMEGVVWSLATLHQFIAYHVKATKAMMHSRMRRRVAAMTDLLGAATPLAGATAAAAAG
ncbi:hypothetical protein Agub_g7194, partial [Astrephomene gubernaculifera]